MFQAPVNQWSASIFGISVSPDTWVDAGKTVHIKCTTMCGNEEANGEYILTQRMTVKEAARRAQFAASIQHVTHRGCEKCRDLYQHGTNKFERQFLFSTYPELGPIVGMDVCGKYGVPLGQPMPEELGITDPDHRQAIAGEWNEQWHKDQDQIKRLLRASGKIA